MERNGKVLQRGREAGMIVGVPSGIGDVSWVYSKLCNAGEKLEYEVADGWLYRTTQFLELLPGVAKTSYGQFRYDEIMAFEHATGIGDHPTWAAARAVSDRILIAPNRHPEMGRRLEDWLLDLPTSFHYEIDVPVEDQRKAYSALRPLRPP